MGSDGVTGQASNDASPRAKWGAGQRLKNDVLVNLARGAIWLVGLLPMALCRLLGAAVGLLGYVIAVGERQKAVAGLATAFPDATSTWRRQTARRCFVGLGRSAAEVCRMGRVDLLDYVALDEEHRAVIDEALSLGRGVIWVTAHLGNWELLAAGLSARSWLVRPFAKESYDPRMTDLIDRWRAQVGVQTIWRRRGGGAAAVQETLGKGGILGVLMDQDTRVRGCFVPFFGRPAWTPSGAAELARQTGSPVVAGFIYRRPGGNHEIRVQRIEMTSGDDSKAADVANTAALTRAIESSIRERPADWVWMHRRWATRPQEEDAS